MKHGRWGPCREAGHPRPQSRRGAWAARPRVSISFPRGPPADGAESIRHWRFEMRGRRMLRTRFGPAGVLLLAWLARSEERRVGKECGSGWAPSHDEEQRW